MFKKFIASALVLAMATIGFVGCANNNQQSGSNSSDSIVVAIKKDENTLTPFTYLTGSPGLEVTRLIYDSLYTKDKDNNIIPWMASEVIPDEQFKTFSIKIKENQMWHDGNPVTLEDVKFTFEYVTTQATTRWSKIGNLVESMSIEGDTLTLVTKKSEPKFIDESLTDLPIVPKHIYENQDNAKEVKETVGSGAYKLSEYVQGQKYVLSATENYFMGDVKVGTINLPIITDTSAIYQGVQTGEYTTFTGSLTPELVDTFSAQENLEIVEGSGFASQMLLMNMEVEPFNNLDFRKAVTNAIDTQAIIDTVYLGKAEKATAGYYNPNSPYSYIDETYNQNIDEANRLLDTLGYTTKDAEGVRSNAAGMKLEFELLTTTDPLKVRTAEEISRQLLAVGIKANVTSYESDTLDTYVWPDFDVTNKRNYQMSIWGWSAPGQTEENTLLELGSSDTSIGIYNLTSYKNSDFDLLVDRYNSALTQDERTSIITEMQEHFKDNIPFLPTVYQNYITVYNKDTYDGFVFQNGTGIINIFSFVDVK